MASAKEYLVQLQALLPEGGAWPREPDAALTRLLSAFADEFARVDSRARALIEEADPRTTLELLPDWERLLALPDSCVPDAQTLQQRRAAVLAKLVTLGGQSRSYFIGLAAALGYEVSITEFRPFRAGMSSAGDPLTGGDWVHTWRVNGPENTIRNFAAGQSNAGEPIRSWGNAQLECVIDRFKPAHTILQFAYGT